MVFWSKFTGQIYMSWPSAKVKPFRFLWKLMEEYPLISIVVMGHRHLCILFCVILDLPGKEWAVAFLLVHRERPCACGALAVAWWHTSSQLCRVPRKLQNTWKSPVIHHYCIILIWIQQSCRNSLQISTKVSLISEINLGPVRHPIKNRQGRSSLTAAWTFLAWNAAVTEQLRFSYIISWWFVFRPHS